LRHAEQVVQTRSTKALPQPLGERLFVSQHDALDDRAPFAASSQVVNVGQELRAKLEPVARTQGSDVTGLVRRVLREYLEQFERERGAKANPP
jgi:hypothetical protein